MNDYHYHLQAAIYSLIREGGLPSVHEKRGYKFFCFSNIFPFGNFEQGVERNLLVSSPDHAIIESIERAASSKIKSRQPLAMGGLRFTISCVSKPFRTNLEGPEITVRSATPIVMRIPKTRYEEYGIKPEIDYDYVFWRETIPLDAFVKQLQDGMIKKWKEYFASSPNDENRFAEEELLPEITYYKFIRTISKPLVMKMQRQMVIGSLWEIGFASTSDVQRRLLEFAIDCGFGERNSLGFGFVNPQHLSG